MIQHVGIVIRLDAWRVEVCHRHPEVSSLQEWADLNPTWNELCEIADELSKSVVASPNMFAAPQDNSTQLDQEYQTTKTYHKDLLLYEETTYAMNHGDIGRLDACMVEWIFYFMGCGKTKYAHDMFRYLENMYITYPKPLV